MRFKPLFHNKIRHLFSLALFLCTFLILSNYAFSAEEEDFFSYKRFFLNQSLVDRIPKDGRAQRDINEFASNYTEGIYQLSSGEIDKAEKDLLKAREAWPEYFGTDFLLALVYEEKGDYKTAARYYKSYLNKLKNYHSGNYRISAPLILSITSFEIEPYEPARNMVEKRLELRGVSMKGVYPVFAMPTFIVPIFFFFLMIAAYLVTYYRVWPYLKKEYRRHNPPEGFWICRHCNNANTDLDKECQECRRPRE